MEGMKVMTIFLLMPIFLPILLGILWRLMKLEGKKLYWASVATMAVTSLCAAAAALLNGVGEIILPWTNTLTLMLRVDKLSSVYLLLISLIWPGVGLLPAKAAADTVW